MPGSRYSDQAVRTQVFTIGAGRKVSAAALGAGWSASSRDRPVAVQLLLVASSPPLAGILGSIVLGATAGHGSGSAQVPAHRRLT
jgi:hypothetical protein